MREIGTIPDETDARRFADYLMTLKITTRLDPKPAGCVVWVHREERVEEGRRELGEFLTEPNSPKYRGVEESARALRKKAEREDRLHVRNSIPLSGRWDYRPAERCPMTILLIVASVAVTLLSSFGARDERILPLYFASYRAEPAGFNAEGRSVVILRPEGLKGLQVGQVWRLVTPIFIHFFPLHLLFNMIWLYDLGGMIEMRKGSLRLGALVLISAVASNVAEYGYSGPLVRFGGMSGVVYALFGYVWMAGRYEPAGGMGLRQSTVQIMLFWLVVCMTGVVGPVANVAHFVGLVVGVIAGIAPHVPRLIRRWV